MKGKKPNKRGGKRKSDHVPISANGRRKAELGHVPISDEITYVALSLIQPSPQNDKLYKPVNPDDPDFKALVENVRANGVREALIVTPFGYIISGHRRYAAAKVVGLEIVPCRTADIEPDDPRFLPLLRDMNRQRVKTLDEVVREEVVSADPEEAHRLLREHRERESAVDVDTIALGNRKHRARITEAKRPLLDAILDIVRENRNVRLSVRQIFYLLLNVNPPPLVHAGKADSVYRNSLKCYKAVDDLCVRARLTGEIPFNAIHDPTRPITLWTVFANPAPFFRSQLDGFLKGYYRDLMQSQPNHVEIIGEKNTIAGVIRPVAMDYVIPYTIGRGYSSLPPRHDMAERFRRCGKERLILLVLSDFDPEGEDIGRSFAQSMRDDFGIDNIVPIKVALTGEQVELLNLPPNLTAKETSSRRKRFVERHGENVFELEAIPPATLQQYLRGAIENVIDLDAYNAEVEREKQDAAYLDTVRRQAHAVLGKLGSDEE
jgi:ParB-like chromosome segregation protein Spo0J